MGYPKVYRVGADVVYTIYMYALYVCVYICIHMLPSCTVCYGLATMIDDEAYTLITMIDDEA